MIFYDGAFIAKVKYQRFQPKDDVGTLWLIFSKEEIADFSHSTGDTNSIHLTDNPAVQGFSNNPLYFQATLF